MEDQFQAIPEVSSQLPAQQQSNVLADASIINKIQEKANQNNQLLEQVNSLTTTLAKGTLSAQEQARLTPQQLRAIQNNDMNSIAQQVGMVKWTMSERGRQLDSSLKFFAETQAQFREEQRMKREDSRRNILEAIEMVGSEAFAGMSDADKRRVEREAGFETGFLSRAQTGLQARERKLEEERQLQLEQARQQMELARRAADLDERQFGFSQEMARAELSLSQAKLAEDKRQANMVNARASSEAVKPLSEWEAKAVERSEVRNLIREDAPQQIIRDGLAKNQSKQAIATSLLENIRGRGNLQILTQKELQEEVYRFVGLTPESEEWK
jgi:hypothetical protein